MTFYAKVKFRDGIMSVVVTVDAKDKDHARTLIEAQYYGCKITTSPTTIQLR